MHTLTSQTAFYVCVAVPDGRFGSQIAGLRLHPSITLPPFFRFLSSFYGLIPLIQFERLGPDAFSRLRVGHTHVRYCAFASFVARPLTPPDVPSFCNSAGDFDRCATLRDRLRQSSLCAWVDEIPSRSGYLPCSGSWLRLPYRPVRSHPRIDSPLGLRVYALHARHLRLGAARVCCARLLRYAFYDRLPLECAPRFFAFCARCVAMFGCRCRCCRCAGAARCIHTRTQEI